ncbi:MMPL family transporter [Vibrio amylolyticus]|uniref:MMPL family transporter n=1 Tax=Vibrio amylolyticus TaxID=2847292 RepID=UPI00354AE4B3
MTNRHSLNSEHTATNSPIPKQQIRLASLWALLVFLCIGLLVKQWGISSSAPIETNILKLLPTDEQNPLAEQAYSKIADNMSNQVVFVLSNQALPSKQSDKTGQSTNKDTLFSAAEQFEHQLRQSNAFKSVTAKVDASTQQQWAEYYYQHRFNQLTDEQKLRLENHPEQQVQSVVQAIYNPFSGVTGQELSSDPFLLFREYLQHVSASSSRFALDNNYLVTDYQDSPQLLITAELNDSPYSDKAQQIVPQLKQWQQELQQQYQVNINHTGVLFYADFGTRSAKSEISTIGVFSLLGVVLLITLIFRSTAPLLLALLSISVGLLVALAITTLIFGQIHLFSLVFGASLIGVSIDYAFHYLTDRLAAGRHWNSIRALKHLFMVITFGLLTSLIGYLGLLIAPFPGLQQLALFSAIGLTAAYATVIAWYPILAHSPSNERPLPGRQLWSNWLDMWDKPSFRFGLPITIVVISGLAMTQVEYNDDIHQLQAMPADLKQQEEVIARVTGIESSQQILLLSAGNDESLLIELERLDNTLSSWQEQGLISNYQGLNQYVSSQQKQLESFTLIQSLYRVQGQALASNLQLENAPVLSQSFKPYSLSEYLEHPVSAPTRFLYLDKIGQGQGDGRNHQQVPINPQVRTNHHVHSLVLLKGVSESLDLALFASNHEQLIYLNKVEQISTLFASYRIKIMELLGIAILLITSLLSLRYGAKQSIKILIPSLIACVAGLAVTVIFGSTLNLFNLLALILIIGIGIDYTLFFSEHNQSHSTLLAITLSALTTLLSFGLLALSNTHAIHSFGITVLAGIFVAWLLAPIAIKLEDKI